MAITWPDQSPVGIYLTHWKPLHNINCAHRCTGPLLKFNGTGTLDHCTFDQYLLVAVVYGLKTVTQKLFPVVIYEDCDTRASIGYSL